VLRQFDCDIVPRLTVQKNTVRIYFAKGFLQLMKNFARYVYCKYIEHKSYYDLVEFMSEISFDIISLSF